jgi:polyhydroxyalkanoate synthesis regulator phasin
MKKTIIGVAIAAVVAIGVGVHVANTKVENKFAKVINDMNTQNVNYKVLTDVSANILTGSLEFNNAKLTTADNTVTVSADVKITGIKFYDDQNVFSNHVTVQTKNIVYAQEGFNYNGENFFEVKNDPETGELKASVKASSSDKVTPSIEMSQNASIHLINTHDVYNLYAKTLTKKIYNENADVTSEYSEMLTKLNDVVVKNVTVSLNNNKLLQKQLMEDMKATYPNATEAELKSQYESNMLAQTELLPVEVKQPFRNFIKNEKYSITMSLDSLKDNTVFNIYQEIIMGKDPEKLLAENYKITAKE